MDLATCTAALKNCTSYTHSCVYIHWKKGRETRRIGKQNGKEESRKGKDGRKRRRIQGSSNAHHVNEPTESEENKNRNERRK